MSALDDGPIVIQAQEEGPRPADDVFDGLDDSLLTRDETTELSTIAELVDMHGILNLPPQMYARMRELRSKGTRKESEP